MLVVSVQFILISSFCNLTVMYQTSSILSLLENLLQRLQVGYHCIQTAGRLGHWRVVERPKRYWVVY